MQLEIQSIAFKKGAFSVVTAPSKVPCERFAANAVDREGSEVFVAYGTGYPLSCATFRRSGNCMIITWKPEVYQTAASLASMLHVQGYDMDKIAELLRRRTSQPMRGLQDAIEKLPRRRKGTLKFSPDTERARPATRKAAKRARINNFMAEEVAARVAGMPVHGQFGVLATRDIKRGTTFHFANSDYILTARRASTLVVERNTFSFRAEDATNDTSMDRVFTCRVGGLLQAINSAHGDQKHRSSNICLVRHLKNNTLYAKALRNIKEGEELLLEYKWER